MCLQQETNCSMYCRLRRPIHHEPETSWLKSVYMHMNDCMSIKQKSFFLRADATDPEISELKRIYAHEWLYEHKTKKVFSSDGLSSWPWNKWA